jgi:hypothetical protein
MTQVLQLLTFVGAIACLILYGFYRDKQEHRYDRSGGSTKHDDTSPRRGAAMSRTQL